MLLHTWRSLSFFPLEGIQANMIDTPGPFGSSLAKLWDSPPCNELVATCCCWCCVWCMAKALSASLALVDAPAMHQYLRNM